MRKIKIRRGQPYPLGAHACENGINFSMVNNSESECGIVLYKKGVEQRNRIPFDKKHKIGNISCVFVEGISISECEYNFYVGDQIIVDPYSKRILGNEKWRSGELKRPVLRGGLCHGNFLWQDTEPLNISYNEKLMSLNSTIYKMFA